MKFILLIFIAALSLESIGTYVSVFGLSKTFDSDPVIISMAIVLDFVKIVVVSLMYKHWDRLGSLLKTLLLPATMVTMLITSYGVAGYMSNAFQGAIQNTSQIEVQLKNYQRERSKLEARKKEMDEQIAQMPKNYITARQRLLKTFEPELKPLNARLRELDKQILDLQQNNITANHDLGPIAFLSKALNIEVQTAVGILIGLVVFVFDPLAVLLLISGNMLIKDREKQQESIRLEKLELEKEKVILEKAKINHEIEETIKKPDVPEDPKSYKILEDESRVDEHKFNEPEEPYIENKTISMFEHQEHPTEIVGEWVSAVSHDTEDELREKEEKAKQILVDHGTPEKKPEGVNLTLEVDDTPESEISVTSSEVVDKKTMEVEELQPITPMIEEPETLEFPEVIEPDITQQDMVLEVEESQPIAPEEKSTVREIVEVEDKGHTYAKWTAAVHNPSAFIDQTDPQEPEPIIDSVAELEKYLSDLNEKSELTPEEIDDKEKIENYLRRKDEERDGSFLRDNPLGIDVR